MKRLFTLSLAMTAYVLPTLAFVPAAKHSDRANPRSISIHLRVPHKTDPTRTTLFSLGLYDISDRLRGLGLNIAGNISRETSGLLVSGIGNITGENTGSIQLSGITNISGENHASALISGLMNVSSGKTQNSLLMAGLCTVSSVSERSLLISGLLNVNNASKRSLSLAGLANIAITHNGLAIAPINVTASNRGLVAGVFNLHKTSSTTPDSIPSQQGKGVQLGVVNVSSNHSQTQIGLFNFSPGTRLEGKMYISNEALVGFDMRIRQSHTYSSIGIGSFHQTFDRKASLGIVYRFGSFFPLANNLAVSVDAGYKHLIRLASLSHLPHTLYALQPRLNIEYQFSPTLGIYVSGGYQWTRAYKGYRFSSEQVTAEIGLTYRFK